MKILVTGARGFIGQNLLNAMADLEHEIIAFSRSHMREDFICGKNIEYVSGDIFNFDCLLKYSYGCDALIHLASITSYYDIMDNPYRAFDCSIQGIINILRVCEVNNINILYFASSGKVYEKCNMEIPISESNPTNPSTWMGMYKLQVEQLIQLYSNINPNKAVIITRIFNAFGLKQNNKFLIPKLISSMYGEKIFVCNDNSKRDYIYIYDIIMAILLLIENPETGLNIYNVGSGIGLSIGQIIAVFEKITHKNLNIEFSSYENRLQEGQYECADITKIKLKGWKLTYNFETALAEMLENFIW
ncbi:NAD dependent epimerase/dehydratase family protein [Anaerocolumna jejuensis DSM 15929]|uniref:NAD dependent epimerase/dehydratase family protein n=1 Tax=Anaerocolumna jejuensis DSM 15929 TaxID=1121322 RepID=A0A1M7DM47_9FIRM|nr:NAD(P)-dependent oxidoreductase [Anaerocolumna jejuensis]SHL80542.1 NAD dependent epimerase/dehydratase family protein [Anaerocolumna jejuensis DSM 15929]